jgi:hypothetical protein
MASVLAMAVRKCQESRADCAIFSLSADITANLKNRVTKPEVVRVLATLHDKGEITGKAYGKTNIYCSMQATSVDDKSGQVSEERTRV